MKKNDLGQILSVVANLGVIAGILLLAYELNQNRQMMQAQTRNAIAETLVNLLAVEASTPEIMQMNAKRNAGEPLNTVEELTHQTLDSAYWRYRENVHYQYRNGLYEESEYLAQREVWLSQINTDATARSGWCARLGMLSLDFVSEIQAQMDRPCE